MFTQTLTRRILRSPLVDLLTGPHGVDTYTELVNPSWTGREARATVVAVRRQTPRSVTLTLEPNALCAQLFTRFRAGQHVNVTVEIDGRRYTRCYSPANAEGAPLIELTVSRRDGGRMSGHLCATARPGLVVGLRDLGGEFTLDRAARRILFVSGGSGITPVMSMLRTLRSQAFDGEIAFVHYARTPDEACYAGELAGMPNVRVLHGYTRSGAGELIGHLSTAHLDAAMPAPDAVYVCGPPALADAVKDVYPSAHTESFAPPVFAAPVASTGGRISFTDSGVEATDDGRPLLVQAEAVGLRPESGCRMGICHSCTRRKTRGVVKNLITGAVSTTDEEDVQICVSAPVGDVDLAL